MYTLFTHQYLWNKFKWNFYVWESLKDDVYRRKPATLDDLRENIAMSCAAITLDTLQNVVHAAVRRLRQCLDADGGHFEHLHWIQNSRTSLISILLLYKYSSYDYREIFFMSKCAYFFLGHPIFYDSIQHNRDVKPESDDSISWQKATSYLKSHISLLPLFINLFLRL